MLKKLKINYFRITSIILFISLKTFGQTTNEKVKLISFIPKTNAYSIYYPDNFILNQDEENIVSFTNPKSGLNITISSYSVDKRLEAENIIEKLGGFVTELKKTDWKSYKSKFDNLIEGRVEKTNDNWIWWGISLDKRVVIMSANKAEKINEDEIKLLRFIIEKLEIY